MYWTLELASKLEDAPWPLTKDELLEYCIRTGAPSGLVSNIQELEDDNEIYESIEEQLRSSLKPISDLPELLPKYQN